MRACKYDGTKVIDLGRLGGLDTYAWAINNKGEVVGQAQGKGGDEDRYAVLYRNGKLADLNRLIAPGTGWKLEVANDINDKGQIVGSGRFQKKRHAFLLTPRSPP